MTAAWTLGLCLLVACARQAGEAVPTSTAVAVSTSPTSAPTSGTATGASGAPRDVRLGAPGDNRPAVPGLLPGACFNEWFSDEPPSHVRTELVSCAVAHDAEVYAQVVPPDWASAGFPGERATERRATTECLDRFEGFVGREYALSELRLGVLRPTPVTWAAGDRTVVCSVYSVALQPLVGSVAGIGL